MTLLASLLVALALAQVCAAGLVAIGVLVARSLR
jgi:hypothetical protein